MHKFFGVLQKLIEVGFEFFSFGLEIIFEF